MKLFLVLQGVTLGRPVPRLRERHSASVLNGTDLRESFSDVDDNAYVEALAINMNENHVCFRPSATDFKAPEDDSDRVLLPPRQSEEPSLVSSASHARALKEARG